MRPSADDGTEIDFHHSGLAATLECYGEGCEGWDQHLARLQGYLATANSPRLRPTPPGVVGPQDLGAFVPDQCGQLMAMVHLDSLDQQGGRLPRDTPGFAVGDVRMLRSGGVWPGGAKDRVQDGDHVLKRRQRDLVEGHLSL